MSIRVHTSGLSQGLGSSQGWWSNVGLCRGPTTWSSWQKHRGPSGCVSIAPQPMKSPGSTTGRCRACRTCDTASKERWFSRMDLSETFFRISVPRAWRHLTAFNCDGQDYWFRRMPIGLKTAPSVFQKFMDHTLAPAKEICFWYIDDVLVFGATRLEVRQRTTRVKALLTRAGNQIKEAKSEYEVQGLLFAGM